MKKKKVSRRAGSIEEVILFGTTVGATERAARWFWNKCEGCDWENNGKPIKNWKATFCAWWDAEYFPRNTYPAGSAGPTLDELTDKIKSDAARKQK